MTFPKLNLLRIAMIGMLALTPLALASCDNDGPAEEAGEKIDEAVGDTKRAIEDATD